MKTDGVEFDGQSYLFWEYIRILKEVKPKYFLLENVKMAKKWENIFTRELNIEPIEINSSLVSAQNRKRLYWTNIPNVSIPEDKHIQLQDILENVDFTKKQSRKLPPFRVWGGMRHLDPISFLFIL